jgi:hypothetical protein
MSAIKYHLDEHIANAIAAGLRRRGIDVTTTVEAGLMHASDEHQIEFASTSSRVFVTCDRRIQASPALQRPHSGVAIMRSGRGHVSHNINALVHMTRTRKSADMKNAVVFL